MTALLTRLHLRVAVSRSRTPIFNTDGAVRYGSSGGRARRKGAGSGGTSRPSSLSAGMVGYPNVGKSTLFNAIVGAQKAEAKNYPFCTINANRLTVPVPDGRLELLGGAGLRALTAGGRQALAAQLQLERERDASNPASSAHAWMAPLPTALAGRVGKNAEDASSTGSTESGALSLSPLSKQIVPATVDVVDIAGLVRGAAEGKGMGNQFLGDVRGVNALIQVVRCFPDSKIMYAEDGSNTELKPVREFEAIQQELAKADLQHAQRRLAVIKTKLQSWGAKRGTQGEAEALRAFLLPVCERIVALLEQGRRAWDVVRVPGGVFGSGAAATKSGKSTGGSQEDGAFPPGASLLEAAMLKALPCAPEPCPDAAADAAAAAVDTLEAEAAENEGAPESARTKLGGKKLPGKSLTTLKDYEFFTGHDLGKDFIGQLLTWKPVLVIANVGQEDAVRTALTVSRAYGAAAASAGAAVSIEQLGNKFSRRLHRHIARKYFGFGLEQRGQGTEKSAADSGAHADNRNVHFLVVGAELEQELGILRNDIGEADDADGSSPADDGQDGSDASFYEEYVASLVQEAFPGDDQAQRSSQFHSQIPLLLHTIQKRLLRQQTFYTQGETESKAWPFAGIGIGSAGGGSSASGGQEARRAPNAAASIHTDFKERFTACKVWGWSWADAAAAAHAAPAARSECFSQLTAVSKNKDYLVRDGDVLEFLIQKSSPGGGKKR